MNQPGRRRTGRHLLDAREMSITAEAEYITKRAADGETRIVSLGSLILFSTATGDAWLLDPEDGLALCLAEAGNRCSYRIVEDDQRYVIEWTQQYRIEGPAMILVDSFGSSRRVLGYPVEEIRRAIRSSRT